MAWLTPGEFETAVKIERTCGAAGFYALLGAARFMADDRDHAMIQELWPGMSPGDHSAGIQIAEEYMFRSGRATFLAAAALHADLENQRKIEQICPGLNDELSIRYNTAGSLIPGERRMMDGKTYRCVGIVNDYGETVSRKVVEVENE